MSSLTPRLRPPYRPRRAVVHLDSAGHRGAVCTATDVKVVEGEGNALVMALEASNQTLLAPDSDSLLPALQQAKRIGWNYTIQAGKKNIRRAYVDKGEEGSKGKKSKARPIGDLGAMTQRLGLELDPADSAKFAWDRADRLCSDLRATLGVPLLDSAARTCLQVLQRGLKEKYQCGAGMNELIDLWHAKGGGRVEVFSPGDHKKRGVDLDMNSAYCAALLEPLPGQYLGLGKNPFTPCSMTIATVHVTGRFPPLRYLSDRGHVYFPKGRWTGLFLPEELAARGVNVMHVHRVHLFAPRQDLAYGAEALHNARTRAGKDSELGAFIKIATVAGIGALGANKATRKVVTKPEEGACYHSPGLWVVERESVREPPHALYPVNMAIVGRTRVKLGEAIYQLSDAGFAPCSVDTDGIDAIGSGKLPPWFKVGDGPGEWRCRRTQRIEVFGAKASIVTFKGEAPKIRAGGLSKEFTAAQLRSAYGTGKVDVVRMGKVIEVALQRKSYLEEPLDVGEIPAYEEKVYGPVHGDAIGEDEQE